MANVVTDITRAMEAGKVHAYFDLDTAFHQIAFRHCGNEYLSASYEGTRARSRHCLVTVASPADLPPIFGTVLSWNFPFMIPFAGRGDFHEEIEVYGCADSPCAEAG